MSVCTEITLYYVLRQAMITSQYWESCYFPSVEVPSPDLIFVADYVAAANAKSQAS